MNTALPALAAMAWHCAYSRSLGNEISLALKDKTVMSLCAALTLVPGLTIAAELTRIGEQPVIGHHYDQQAIETAATACRAGTSRAAAVRCPLQPARRQGRPETPAAAPRVRPASRPSSAPRARRQRLRRLPRPAGLRGAGDFVANVFVLAQTLDRSPSRSMARSATSATPRHVRPGAIEMLAREMSAD